MVKGKHTSTMFPIDTVEMDIFNCCMELKIDEGWAKSISRALQKAGWTIAYALDIDKHEAYGLTKDVIELYCKKEGIK